MKDFISLGIHNVQVHSACYAYEGYPIIISLGIHNVQVHCACYAYEGYPIINLLQANAFADGKKRICLYFHFCNTFVQEAAYALWLEDQRKALFEKAALYLEAYADKCRSCGGNGFIPGHGVGTTLTNQLDKSVGRRYSGKYSVVVAFICVFVPLRNELFFHWSVN